MKKICICGKVRQTQNILNFILKKYSNLPVIKPFKNSKSIYDFAIFNENKNIYKKTNNLSCKILIINTDLSEAPFCFKKADYIVSVGLNRQSCITLTSISDNKFQFCIRQNLLTISGSKICEQEFGVNTNIKNTNILMSALTAAILSDIDISNLNNFYI